METREQRGLEIAAKSRITRKGKTYHVPSQSGRGEYTVEYSGKAKRCTCPDFEARQSACKHVIAVQIYIERERRTEGNVTTVTETRTVKVSYSQDWRALNQAQQKEKALFQHLLYDLCQGIIEPPAAKGRPPFSLADMVFSSVFKVYSTFSGRRFATDLEEAYKKGYLERKPAHYNSIFRYFEKPSMTPLLKALITQSAIPLKALETSFAVDSSGFSTCVYDRWFDEKYGQLKSKNSWVKCHLMCGTETHVVTSVEVTGCNAADSPQFPGLVMDTAQNFNVEEVSADKAYSSLDNHQWAAAAGAVPYIAFKSNTNPRSVSLFAKMYHMFCINRDEFMANYHKRSNVETTFSMIKSKFGSKIRSKTPVAQTNEVLCKVLAHNICCVIQSTFEFGIDPGFYGASVN